MKQKVYEKIKDNKYMDGSSVRYHFKIDTVKKKVTCAKIFSTAVDRPFVASVTCHEGDTFDPMVGMMIAEDKADMRAISGYLKNRIPEFEEAKTSYPLGWAKYKAWCKQVPDVPEKKGKKMEEEDTGKKIKKTPDKIVYKHEGTAHFWVDGIYNIYWTMERKEVTCKRCLKILNKGDK